jgi:hypothetical protein
MTMLPMALGKQALIGNCPYPSRIGVRYSEQQTYQTGLGQSKSTYLRLIVGITMTFTHEGCGSGTCWHQGHS